ncbi:MAG: NAD-dependent epimerase/dehydratase family protein [Chloroflexi bacterium]|nr:NAD-dependent epimerase/dehydratase family protein [Chloroflexota bacterium]
MRVLVTGATGFVGGNLARELCQRGDEVCALVRPGSSTLTIQDTQVQQIPGDILDAESVRRALVGCQQVYHCAGSYTFWSRDVRDIYRTNVEGTRIVLQEARQAGVDKIVYTSTVGAIGLPKQGLGTEETPVESRHLIGHYKRSKYQAEQVALEMASQGLPVVVVNPAAPVGPWDVKPTPTGRIVLDFLNGKIPAYIETGMNVVDVSDVAAGHILAMEKGKPGQRYVLGNRNLSLQQIFEMLELLTGRRAPRWKLPFWAALGAGYIDQIVEGKILRREPMIPLEGLKVARIPLYASSQKAITELGLPQSPVEAALERAVKWFQDYGYRR